MFTLMIDPKQGPFPTDREAKIRERARQIWEDEGRPVGKERMLWDRAKLEIRGDDGTKPDPDAAARRGTLANTMDGKIRLSELP